MGEGPVSTKRSHATPLLAHASGFVVLFFLAMWLRAVPLQSDPILQGYLQVTTGLLAFVFAAVTLVRFQGTQDRISLILGSGFLLSGTILTASSVLFFQFLQEAPVHLRWAPVSWWVSRIVLGLLLVVALLVEHFLPRSRHPRLEISGALLTVIALTYLITAALRRLPQETSPHPLAFIPSPQQLLPAGLFLVSLVWFRRRLQIEDSAFDRAIYSAAWMNVAAQLAASQSVRLLDSPFVLAQALTVTSYAIALGGALLDNARLFEQVQHLAVSDPLTGLANYRRLLDVLESETERTNRNGRPFAVLLLDLDGLPGRRPHPRGPCQRHRDAPALGKYWYLDLPRQWRTHRKAALRSGPAPLRRKSPPRQAPSNHTNSPPPHPKSPGLIYFFRLISTLGVCNTKRTCNGSGRGLFTLLALSLEGSRAHLAFKPCADSFEHPCMSGFSFRPPRTAPIVP
jgi:hypothetical protein